MRIDIFKELRRELVGCKGNMMAIREVMVGFGREAKKKLVYVMGCTLILHTLSLISPAS